jgi:hypothetical protein
MLKISRTDALALSKISNLFMDLEDTIDESMEVIPLLDATLDPAHFQDVLDFVLKGQISNTVLSGKCTGAARYLNVEWLFEERNGRLLAFVDPMMKHLSSTLAFNKFEDFLCKMDVGMWHDYRREIEERRAMLDLSRTTVLFPFTRDAIDAAPLLHDLAGDHVVLYNPNAQRPLILRHDLLSQGLQSLPGNLPWVHASADGVGIVVAGGCLESWLLGQTPKDIDLFVVVPKSTFTTEAQRTTKARSVLEQAIRAICDFHFGTTVRMVVKENVIDLYVGNPQKTMYQLIVRSFESATHVIGGFDIDSCRLVSTGKLLFAHRNAIRAWKNGWNVFTPLTLSQSALFRYRKKYDAGIGIMLVGVTQDKVASLVQHHIVKAGAGTNKITREITVESLVANLIGHRPLPEKRTDYDNDIDHDNDKDNDIDHDYKNADSSPDEESDEEYERWRHTSIARNLRIHRWSLRLQSLIVTSANNINDLFTGAFNPVLSDIYAESHKFDLLPHMAQP